MRALIAGAAAAATLVSRASSAADAGGWHDLPGFDLVLGLAACAAIVFVSKWLGRRFLQRPESYYDRDSP